MKSLIPILFSLFSLALGVHAQTTIFTSDFNANTGPSTLAGNTDNTSGSASATVTWTKHGTTPYLPHDSPSEHLPQKANS